MSTDTRVVLRIDLAGFTSSMLIITRQIEQLGTFLRRAAARRKRPAHLSRMHAAYRAKRRGKW